MWFKRQTPEEKEKKEQDKVLKLNQRCKELNEQFDYIFGNIMFIDNSIVIFKCFEIIEGDICLTFKNYNSPPGHLNYRPIKDLFFGDIEGYFRTYYEKTRKINEELKHFGFEIRKIEKNEVS